MVGLRGLALASIVLLGIAAQASAGAESGAQDQPTTSASAYGVKLLLPNQLPIVAGLVDGAATQAASPVAFAYPEDGSILRAESVAGRSWATRVNAQARADLRVVSLFGGEVTIGAVVARTQASAKTGEESFSGTSVTSLSSAWPVDRACAGTSASRSPTGGTSPSFRSVRPVNPRTAAG